MVSVKVMAFAGVAALMATTAKAADLPQMMPPMLPPPMPYYQDFASGWYLRGDIGMTNQSVGKLDHADFSGVPGLMILDKNFEGGMLGGIGIGYQFNNWLRADVTGEYRGETGFHGLDTWIDNYTDPSDPRARFNNYSAKKSEWLFLANIYADLGTWSGFTPFVGVGFGTSRNTIHSFRDMGIGPAPWLQPTLSYAPAASKWNFAWAVHAGMSYKVTNAVTIEFAYRYVNLGDGVTGDIISYDGAYKVSPMQFNDITSHDFKLGVRWMLDPGPVKPMVPDYPPPLMRRG